MKITQTVLASDLADYVNISDPKSHIQLISDFKKVNFLIGPNNSGKSRFMRTLYYGNHYSFVHKSETNEFNVLFNNRYDTWSKLGLNKIQNIKVERSELNDLSKGFPVTYEKNSMSLDQDYVKKFCVNVNDTMFGTNDEGNTMSLPTAQMTEWNRQSETLNNTFNKLNNSFTKNSANGFYIPIIRGTRPLGIQTQSGEDIFVSRSANDYFEQGKNLDDQMFAGYKMYKQVEDLLLGNEEERELIRDYESFLSKYFFFEKVTIVPQRKKDVLLIKIGKSKERLIYDLGDGVQAVILLTFPIYVRKNKSFVFFIEEPELNLHPSLQRKFLKCISSEFPKHQFFCTTHSNHFLEGITEYENTTLFSFKHSYQDHKFHISQLTSVKTDILDSLGVKNSSVLMSNCTIWVEGITDRLYLRKYLEVYFEYRRKQVSVSSFPLFKEDHHFSFVEYAGSNIVHWSFNENADENIKAAYVANKILLIADSDYDKSGKIPKSKQDRFKKLEKNLGKNFIQIEGKEIENTLKSTIIQKVVADYEKSEIDSITFKKQRQVYKKKNLGKWINQNMEPVSRDYSKDNTISDKLNFCRKAVKNIESYDDLSDEAKSICKKIFSFIQENNTDYIVQ